MGYSNLLKYGYERLKRMEQIKAEIRMVYPEINFDDLKAVESYYFKKLSELPLKSGDDLSILIEIKKMLIRGAPLNESIHHVYNLIDMEYASCLLKLQFGMRSDFNIDIDL